MAKAPKPAAQDAAPLPTKITLTERVFYEIGESGVHRDFNAGDVIINPVIIQELIDFGASYY